jgi:hypothetical protein
MREVFVAGIVALCASLSAPVQAAAQFNFTVGGGVTVPGSTFADGIESVIAAESRQPANNGWSLSLDVAYTVAGSGVTVGARGLMGLTSHVDIEPGTTLAAALLFGEYAFEWVPTVEPFLYAGAGHLSYSYRSRTLKISTKDAEGTAIQLGGGVGLPIGGLTLRLDGSWTRGAGTVDGIDFIRLGATMRMTFGGRD